MARKTLTDKGVAALKPRATSYTHPDPELRGGYVRVEPTGSKSYWAVARNPITRKQVWTKIGALDALSIDEARAKARIVLERVRAGLPAFEPTPVAPDSFRAVAEAWLKRYVESKGLLSAAEIRARLDKHILPVFGDRVFVEIKRSDVAALLDAVEDSAGPRAADHCLEIVRRVMSWHATRADDYVMPLVKGMRRWSPSENAKDRILSDDELRAVWKVAEGNGTFGALVRLALLTASRREKLASMKWSDVTIDGTWTVATESSREKGTIGQVRLPQMAIDIINAQPRLASNPYVFAGRNGSHLNGYSKLKPAFDKKLEAAGYTIEPWSLHDLRRTARSLLSRAGVQPHIAERVLGHVQPGVQGTYDRHQYSVEKSDALAKLAALIDGIVNPRENVVPMTGRVK